MRPTTALATLPLLLTSLTTAITLDCGRILVEKKKFDLSKIGGPHAVSTHDETRPPSVYNTTWTIDICAPLKKVSGIPTGDQCPSGTNICGITKSYNPVDDPDQENWRVENVIPVAGTLTGSGSSIEPKITRLKASDSDSEGLQMELSGGTYGGKKQKAVIVFTCDKQRTGNEGTKLEEESVNRTSRRDDDDKKNDGDKGDESDNPNSLTFVSYGTVEGKEAVDVLRMNWRTKYACEDIEDDDDDKDVVKKGGWGFFTWFILIGFLSIAAYLIFGSWLNYNRYGARGWDLVPHGDTIRDVPYLFKDWSRKVVDTVSGGGTRGGYSAV